MIKPIGTPATNISFGYSTVLSRLWKDDKLPSVTKGFYGGVLSKDKRSKGFCTNEHIKPHSQGGATNISNIALATVENNNLRGNKPLSTMFNPAAFKEYCKEFEDVEVTYKEGGIIKTFLGNNYIQELTKTVIDILKREKRLDLLG